MLEDEDTEEEVAVKDAETLPLYNFNQKETVNDAVINPELRAAQQSEIRELLDEYSKIFSDVPRVTHLIEHKVELTETELVKHKPYPIPYKMGPSPRSRGSARPKTASSLILRGHV